jgi:predicted DNA-binding ribbon-helix-helix protein
MLTFRLGEAIEAVDLKKVEVANLRSHWTRTTVEQTAVSIEPHHKKLLKTEAKRRQCSVNALINAILLHYKKQRGPHGWKDVWLGLSSRDED